VKANPFLTHDLGRHRLIGLVSDIVIAGNHSQTVMVLTENSFREFDGGPESGKLRNWMNQIPQMDHETWSVA
jgi:hypothetical protein